MCNNSRHIILQDFKTLHNLNKFTGMNLLQAHLDSIKYKFLKTYRFNLKNRFFNHALKLRYT